MSIFDSSSYIDSMATSVDNDGHFPSSPVLGCVLGEGEGWGLKGGGGEG